MSQQMISDKDVEKYYNENVGLYSSFLIRLEQKITNELHNKDCKYIKIESRIKKLESLIKKVKQKAYTDLAKQFTDFAALRIIAKNETNVDKICKYIEETFKIDKANSIDKRKLLDDNKVGYLSVHYIVSFPTRALKSSVENQPYKGLKAEIQVRTALQHAWADITHDSVYKEGIQVPKTIKRKINLISGLLELADQEFVNLEDEMRKFNDEIKKNEGIGACGIDNFTLNILMQSLFEGYYFLDVVQSIKEIKEFGISTISEFNNLINKDLIDYFKKEKAFRTYDGIVRNILIISNAEKYFKCENSCKEVSEFSRKMYENFGLNMLELKEKFGLQLS